jgi:hypothetical protein
MLQGSQAIKRCQTASRRCVVTFLTVILRHVALRATPSEPLVALLLFAVAGEGDSFCSDTPACSSHTQRNSRRKANSRGELLSIGVGFSHQVTASRLTGRSCNCFCFHSRIVSFLDLL